MRRIKDRIAWQRIMGVLCGLLSFVVIYLAVPALFMRGVADLVWIVLRLLLPAAVGVVFMEIVGKCGAKYVWLGLPVQYILLIVFAKPLSDYLGVSVENTFLGFGWPQYIGSQFIWPLAVALIQVCVLTCTKRIRK